MRELKFRVWDKQRQKMYTEKRTVSRVLKGYLSGVSGDGLASNTFDYDRYDIQQYIGLKDVNGEEIYEGDIVSYVNDLTMHLPGEILYITEVIKDIFEAHSLEDSAEMETIEVIGNIHESPYLIKKAQAIK